VTLQDYGSETYGERIAEIYDDLYPSLSDNDPMVTLLENLVGHGPALELGIGTGRVALPLARRGVEVRGVDVSPAMVARMRAKPGGDQIPVVLGDFGHLATGERYSLIFVVFNTFFTLPTQDDQVRCFERVAQHLTDEGQFLIAAFVPDVAIFDKGQRTSAPEVKLDRVQIDVTRHERTRQVVTSQHLVFTASDTRFYPVRLRYAWPSELDLMARLAGLRLRSRSGGWQGEPYDDRSELHVSVYGRRTNPSTRRTRGAVL